MASSVVVSRQRPSVAAVRMRRSGATNGRSRCAANAASRSDRSTPRGPGRARAITVVIAVRLFRAGGQPRSYRRTHASSRSGVQSARRPCPRQPGRTGWIGATFRFSNSEFGTRAGHLQLTSAGPWTSAFRFLDLKTDWLKSAHSSRSAAVHAILKATCPAPKHRPPSWLPGTGPVQTVLRRPASGRTERMVGVETATILPYG